MAADTAARRVAAGALAVRAKLGDGTTVEVFVSPESEADRAEERDG